MNFNFVLQIDDDSDDCLFFQEAIMECSSTTVYSCIHNPQEALELLISGTVCPDLILLDMNMPIFNGQEFLEELTKQIKLTIPVVFCSTAQLPSGAVLRKEVAEYVVKPSCYDELKLIVARLLNPANYKGFQVGF